MADEGDTIMALKKKYANGEIDFEFQLYGRFSERWSNWKRFSTTHIKLGKMGQSIPFPWTSTFLTFFPQSSKVRWRVRYIKTS